jgi:GNAT superfamily N-acetyltransferase
MQIQVEHHLTKEIMETVFRMYDENFSPHVKVAHNKIKKRLYENEYMLLSCKNDLDEWIGFCLISKNQLLKTIFIDYLCVDKKFQRGGYGKQILNTINDQDIIPSTQNYKYTILECEDYLIPYYEKNRYKKIPLVYPIENSKPLFLLYRVRKSSQTENVLEMYHKFIFYGLLFNNEIIMCYLAFMIFYENLGLFHQNHPHIA